MADQRYNPLRSQVRETFAGGMRLSLVFAKVFDKMPRRLLLKSLERTQAPADLITLIMFTATQAEPTAENICPAHAMPVSGAEVSAVQRLMSLRQPFTERIQ